VPSLLGGESAAFGDEIPVFAGALELSRESLEDLRRRVLVDHSRFPGADRGGRELRRRAGQVWTVRQGGGAQIE
jgi:hypothetical protein